MALDDIRIVLIEPSHPGNIGAVARAMKTMSLRHLVLVRPIEFPSQEANRRATGAIDLLERAQVVNDLDSAIADCRLVIGGSARPRTVPHSVLDARQCGARLVAETAHGDSAAVLFGPERAGLANADLDRCTFQVRIPANPEFSSLNLAAAVQLICYEILVADREHAGLEVTETLEAPSSQSDMEHFYEHLERALDSRGFLGEDMREVTMTKLRRLFGRSRPSTREVKMLRTLTRLIHRDGK